jgi:DNA primase
MVELPEGVKDADELVQKAGVDALREVIANAKYIVDYLFDRFEKDYDLNTAVGKRGYTDRLAANLRRLGDPVEQDHYVKLLAEKTGTSEEAVRAKLAKAEEPAPAGGLAPQRVKTIGYRRPTTDPAPSEQPVRRAVVQAQGKPSVRVLHEEAFLALNLAYPECRASLDDLNAGRFSSDERRGVFELLQKHREATGAELAGMSRELATYVQRLLFFSEEEYTELNELMLQQEAFSLARQIFLESNKEFKAKINAALREAEKAGDDKERSHLMNQLSAIIDSER